MLEYYYLLNATEQDIIKIQALIRYVGTNYWSDNPTKIIGDRCTGHPTCISWKNSMSP